MKPTVELLANQKAGFFMVILGGPLIIGFLMLWPNMIFHYAEWTQNYMQPFFFGGVFVAAFFVGLRSVFKFTILGIFLLLFASNISYVAEKVHFQLFSEGLLLIFLAAMLYRQPRYIGFAFKVLVFLAVIFSIQTVIVFMAWLIGYRIPVECNDFLGYIKFTRGMECSFNLWLGDNGYLRRDWYGFRATGYFTEANRLAYFQTIPMFLAYHYRKESFYYHAAFYLIIFSIMATVSVVGMAAAFGAFFLYKNRNLSRKVKGVLFLLFIVIPTLFIVVSVNPEMFGRILDKSGSFAVRLAGAKGAMLYLLQNPFGFKLGDAILSQELMLASGVSIGLFYWIFWGGLVAAGLLLPILFVYLINMYELVAKGDQFERMFGYASLAYFMEQSFFGNYFESYFIAVMAVTLAINRLRARLAIL